MKVKLMISLISFLLVQDNEGYNHVQPSIKPGHCCTKPAKKHSTSPFSIFKIYSPVFKYLS
jgi:hypothetical protein